MQSLTAAERDRIDGLAVFAATSFVVGAGVIAALERVGAPDALVEGLGPLFAFSALSVIGLSNRAASLTDYLAARRAIPAFYAALGFAALVGGIALALAAGASRPDDIPWLPMAAGAALAGLFIAPTIRGRNVSSAIDVLATRFPALSTRIAFGVVLFACGVLTASAGFQLASQSFAQAIGDNLRAGDAFALCALAFTLAPGGMKSASWADAASGGGAMLIVVLGAAFALYLVPAPLTPISAGLAELTAKAQAIRADPSLAVALAVAFAFYFPLLAPGMATPTPREARRAGLGGLTLSVFGLGAAAIALPMLASAPASARHTGQALLSAAIWLPSLALARAGALAASRAVGIDLARAYSRLTVLSSRRIAVNRLAMLLAIGLSPFVLPRLGLTTDQAVALALAGSLALLAPSLILALALPGRASSLSAILALLTAAGGIAAQAKLDPAGFLRLGVVGEALTLGSLALGVGALAALVIPSRSGRRHLPPADPFVDLPFDTIDAA
jgi:Na+/proline symporter